MSTIAKLLETTPQNAVLESLYIYDYEADLEALDVLLAKIDSLSSIRLDMSNLKTFPNGLAKYEKLTKMQLDIRAVSSIRSDQLPDNLERFELTCQTLNKIPEKLWISNLTQLKIKCRQLNNQKVKSKINPQINVLWLKIDSMERIPVDLQNHGLRRLIIESDKLRQLPDGTFTEGQLHNVNINSKNLETPRNIERCTSLTSLTLKSDLPLSFAEVSLPASLHSISLESPLTILPSLAHLTNLRYLRAHGLQGTLDHGIGLCTQLNQLYVLNSELTEITAQLAELKKLKYLTIEAKLTDIPPQVLLLSQLENLGLARNSINNLDLDWSNLKSLKILNLEDNSIRLESLSFVSDLPALDILRINGNTWPSKYLLIQKKRPPLQNCDYILNNTSVLERDVLKMGAALAKISFSDEIKKTLFDAFWTRGSLRTSFLERGDLLFAGLNLQYAPAKSEATEVLSQFIDRYDGTSTLDSGKVIYIEGKPTETLTKLKSIIKNQGYSSAAKLDDTVTHIIIGRNPKNTKVLDTDKYKYIRESLLHEMKSVVNPGFLEVKSLEENDQTLGKVKLLLDNDQLVNVKIGLNMLEQGGVPQDLCSTLLVLSKCNEDAKVRAKAKKLLLLNGPAAWKPLLEDKQLFKNITTKAKEQDIKKKLEKVEKATNFELAALLSTELFNKHEKGLRFMVLRKGLSDRWKKRIYDLMVNDGHFNFSRGLGFKNWKGVPESDLTLFPYKISYTFPADVINYHKVESIDLHNTKRTGWPKGLNAFKDLKKLDLSFNMLKTLSPQIKNLENLEYLDLRYNTFEKFPEKITSLPKLKKVDLRRNRQDYDYLDLTIPEEVRSSMPHCEILV